MKLNSLFLILLTALITSCANYRTNTDINFNSTTVMPYKTKIVLSQGRLADKKYAELGPVLAEVKKLTIFHEDPTREQVDYVLIMRAGYLYPETDAVVNIIYSSGWGFFTWGYIEAKGTAVKFIEPSPAATR